MEEIRIYHSFRSPYSRLGLHVIDRAKLNVTLIPFTGPPEGVPFSDTLANEPKYAYARLDVQRMTERMGLTIFPPSPFDVDLTPSYKAAVAAEQDGKGLPFALAVSEARWARGKDISDIDILKECALEAEWNEDAVVNAQTALSIGKTLKRQRALIEQDGVFGVPFAVVGAAKYWGHDRLELFIEDMRA